jgi:hypothetical protein
LSRTIRVTGRYESFCEQLGMDLAEVRSATVTRALRDKLRRCDIRLAAPRVPTFDGCDTLTDRCADSEPGEQPPTFAERQAIRPVCANTWHPGLAPVKRKRLKA